jgi:hypothetical protein
MSYLPVLMRASRWLLLRPLIAAEDLGELGELLGVQPHGLDRRARVAEELGAQDRPGGK